MSQQQQKAGTLDSLPLEVLMRIAKAVQSFDGRMALLRTSKLTRDAVLASTRHVALTLYKDVHPAGMAAEQGLLRRTCETAPSGLYVRLVVRRPATFPGHKLLLEELLEPFREKGLPNVGILALQNWSHCQSLGAKSYIVTYAFPNLRELCLYTCSLDGAAFIASLLTCHQLEKLELYRCRMTSTAIAALPMLQRLTQLGRLAWYEPEDATGDEVTSTLHRIAELTQLGTLIIGSNKAQPAALVSSATRMTQLKDMIVMPDLKPRGPGRAARAAWQAPTLEWQQRPMPAAPFEQLLNSCAALTRICFEAVVLDQAGLDLLLAHPHIVNVTLLAIAATESRVDSPCSWTTLELPHQVDVRTVAYVPLHSLHRPLPVYSLVLPPDVPTDQLPQLVHQASTRMAQHRHLFATQKSTEAGLEWASLCDYISALPTGQLQMAPAQGLQQRFGQEAVTALITALEPLAGVPHSGGLELCFRTDATNQGGAPSRVQIGRAELFAISNTWANRARHLSFAGVALANGFFPALLEAFPQLSELWLKDVKSDGGALVSRLVAVSHRVTHPLTLFLEPSLYEEVKAVMDEFWPPDGGNRPLVTLMLYAA